MAKTTMNLQDDLVKEAMAVTGIREKTAVVHHALKELLRRKAGERLIARGGTDPGAKAPVRNRQER